MSGILSVNFRETTIMIPKLKKDFESDIDNFLKTFDKTHAKHSRSQQREKKIYAQIYKWRDFPTYEKPEIDKEKL